ncbi:MAG: hypothetical protein WC372_10505, partial [Candidatus Neomarinimicrobiota bacterium]
MSVQEMIAKTRMPLLRLASHVGKLEEIGATIAALPSGPLDETALMAGHTAVSGVSKFGAMVQATIENLAVLARSSAPCGELEELLLAQQLLRDLRERTFKVKRALEE